MKNKSIIVIKKIGLSFSIIFAAVIIKTAISMIIGHNVFIAWLTNALVLLPGIAGFFYVWSNYPFKKKEINPLIEINNDEKVEININSEFNLMEKELEKRTPHFENQKIKFDHMPQPHSISLITFEAERKYNLFYTLEKSFKYLGAYTIIFILINSISLLFNNKLIFPWYFIVLFPLFILIQEFLNGKLSRPVNKVIFDMDNRIMFIKYSKYFLFNREYKSSFNKVKFDFINNANGITKKIDVLNLQNEIICNIDSREEIFSEESFKQLVNKIDELTFYVNRKSKT